MTVETKDERAPVLWAVAITEHLTHRCIDDAVEECLDALHSLDRLAPETVAVQGYAPMQPSAAECGPVLDFVIARLEEEYGDPDGSTGTATAAMRIAEAAFIDAVLAEYKVWMHEPVGDPVIVNCAEWISANRPDWLEGTP